MTISNLNIPEIIIAVNITPHPGGLFTAKLVHSSRNVSRIDQVSSWVAINE